MKEHRAAALRAVQKSPPSAAPAPHGSTTHIDHVPSRFFWLIDLLAVTLACGVAHQLSPILTRFLAAGDLLESWLSRFGIPASRGGGEFISFSAAMGAAAVMALGALVSVDLAGGHRPLLRQSRARVLLTGLAGAFGGLGAVTVAVVALRIETMGRSFLFVAASLAAVGLVTWRMALRSYKLQRFQAGHYARHVLLVGTTAHVRWLAEYFARHVPAHAYRVLGALVPAEDWSGKVDDRGVAVPILGSAANLGELLVHLPVNDVVAVQPSLQAGWMPKVVDACDYLRVTLRIVPEALVQARLRDLRPPNTSDTLTLPSLLLTPVELGNQPYFIKRLFDVVVSSVGLLFLAPVLFAVAIAIKVTTPALPVFYRWRVVGYKGREFVGYKFTTMEADADARKADLEHLNEMQGPVFKIKKDPRVTKLGRLLRKYSLNELPQLWSVVRGDMSLVGPRPAFPHELGRYEYWHKRKLSVKPGITCLWQISGRNQIHDFDEWVKLDLEYIDNWSLWLDLRILLWTVVAVVRGTGS